MNNTNPLQQYFRRPSIYMRLPSGGVGYRPGSLAQTDSGELAVYPMTAIDEISINTPDGLMNGESLVSVIRSCVPDILDPWHLNSADLDAVLIAIKIATNGQNLEIETTCPNCTEYAKYDVNLTYLLNSMTAGDYTKEYVKEQITIRFRPLSYKELQQLTSNQFEFQQQFELMNKATDAKEKARLGSTALRSLTEITMNMICQMIDYIRTPESMVTDKTWILDYLKHIDKTTYGHIRDHAIELKSTSEIKPLKIVCQECQHNYEQPFTLNPANFFASGF